MMAFTIKNKKLKDIAATIAVIFIWLLLWLILYKIVSSELLIPSPLSVLKKLWVLIFEAAFWKTVFTSFFRIMAGYLAGVVSGALIAIITNISKPICRFLYPALSIIRATPVASFIILSLVWISNSGITGFMSFLMVLPIVWGNVHKGIEKVDKSLLEMAAVFKLNIISRIKNIYIPSVMPYFTAAFTTALGLSWKAGIAAEVLAIPKNSIGREIHQSKIYLETVSLFSWTLVVIIISILIEKTLLALTAQLNKRRQSVV